MDNLIGYTSIVSEEGEETLRYLLKVSKGVDLAEDAPSSFVRRNLHIAIHHQSLCNMAWISGLTSWLRILKSAELDLAIPSRHLSEIIVDVIEEVFHERDFDRCTWGLEFIRHLLNSGVIDAKDSGAAVLLDIARRSFLVCKICRKVVSTETSSTPTQLFCSFGRMLIAKGTDITSTGYDDKSLVDYLVETQDLEFGSFVFEEMGFDANQVFKANEARKKGERSLTTTLEECSHSAIPRRPYKVED